MMRLSTLWSVDCTADAHGRSPVADRILERWAHDRGSARAFRSSANFVYVFRDAGRRRFLRFAHSSERSRETIEAEVDILNWLAGAGVSVARPLPSTGGNVVETVVTDLGTFHAVVFPALEGACDLDIGDLDAPRFRAWGTALGELHAALKDYPGAGTAARGTWRDHLASAEKYTPKDEPALRREWDRIASALHALPVNRDTYGLIHFDFELDNLCWGDRTIGILDFDDCARYWYVADIAFALRDLFGAGADLGHPSFREFVRGYAAHHPLDEALLAQVPLFLSLSKLLIYARLARATDLPADRDYPEWLEALNRKFQNWMEAYKTSLEGHKV